LFRVETITLGDWRCISLVLHVPVDQAKQPLPSLSAAVVGSKVGHLGGLTSSIGKSVEHAIICVLHLTSAAINPGNRSAEKCSE
jgi:hypothetical protein